MEDGMKRMNRGKLGILAVFTFITMAVVLGITTRIWAQPFAYVANSGSNDVSVIDTATDKVVATIPLSGSPSGNNINEGVEEGMFSGTLNPNPISGTFKFNVMSSEGDKYTVSGKVK
jgi:YVTN family beta-propeller protein